MQYSVGDKVVHPHHGPGRIVGIEQRDLLDGTKRYYVIEVPCQALTVRMPIRKAEEVGIRPAMSQSSLARMLSILGGKPHLLPQDYRERQDQVNAKLRTGRVIHLARVVRDLTWHRQRAHLTRKDSEYLKHGSDLLAAEMSLVSGNTVSDANKLIESTMVAALANRPAQPLV
jgi:CarD family transcriptional regulator